MNDNLKERLTDMSVLASSRTPADALQYIEELEAEIADLKAKLATCKKYRDAYAECDRIATQAVRDLDAKLAKAVWALKPFKILAKHHAADAPEWGPFDSVSAQVSIMYLRDAMTTIAELTGGTDE